MHKFFTIIMGVCQLQLTDLSSQIRGWWEGCPKSLNSFFVENSFVNGGFPHVQNLLGPEKSAIIAENAIFAQSTKIFLTGHIIHLWLHIWGQIDQVYLCREFHFILILSNIGLTLTDATICISKKERMKKFRYHGLNM